MNNIKKSIFISVLSSMVISGFANAANEMNTSNGTNGKWIINENGTAKNLMTNKFVIVGQDGIPGTSDDNELLNPAGKVLLKNVSPHFDSEGRVYVKLGNGFNVYPGADHMIGTSDDIVSGFGSYPQDDLSGNKQQPLDWYLLDIKNNHALLISTKILDAVKFNNDEHDGNEWKTSNIRAWLNSNGGKDSVGEVDGFYNKAFTKAEKNKIVLSKVDMHSTKSFIAYNRLLSSDWWHIYNTQGQATNDYVYTLSGEEFFDYFGKSKIATQKELGHPPANYTNAYFKATPYAIHNGVHANEGGNGPSFVGYADVWTRSKGATEDHGTYYGVFLGSTGSLNSGRPVTRNYGALPVIQVTL